MLETVGLIIFVLAAFATAAAVIDALVAFVVIKIKTMKKLETPSFAERMRKQYDHKGALAIYSVSAAITACVLFWLLVLGGYGKDDVERIREESYRAGYEAGYSEGFDDGYTIAEDNGIYDPDPEMHRVESPG